MTSEAHVYKRKIESLKTSFEKKSKHKALAGLGNILLPLLLQLLQKEAFKPRLYLALGWVPLTEP